ncbi:MAG: tRNA (adenosine(37)-N6)-threonylcarbamoyltransferase complex ATPase subunit type 1 TsaE [Bryobacteraceae bacterium]|nr:tRNA (adenosine(37)-N6)-threonylcarbamoyltransferase complex ATPase subunit type 1 TsaE [Bryobacteraceae bacterium]
MSVSVHRTSSEADTIALGRRIAAALMRPALVMLIGNLGAGKTTLTKGIVQGLGAADPNDVSSPTFTLIHQYAQHVWHIDLYRLETALQVSSLGLEELFDDPIGVILVEWGERFPTLFPPERVEVRIERLREDDDARRLEIAGLALNSD